MNVFKTWCVFAVLGSAALMPMGGQAEAVPPSRLARLTRGVNMGGWILSDYQGKNYVSDAELDALPKVGIRHVRLPVGASLLFDENKPDAIKAETLKALDEVLDRLLSHGLAVIVEPHNVSDRLWTDPAYVAKFARMWEALARHLSRRDPEMVFLEVANEPAAETPAPWYTAQEKLLSAMRRGAPRHTLIANSNMRLSKDQWNDIDTLVSLTPVKDKNVVYNFHFYDPMVFTHQGATWGWDMLKNFHDIPYPSSPEAVAQTLVRTEGAAHSVVEGYGRDRYDAARLEATLKKALAWAAKNHVSLTCNEFGVYRAAPQPSRVRWLRDARTILEKHHIPWTMWEYDSGFGLAETKNGQRVIDPATASALGLAAPERMAPVVEKKRDTSGWTLTFRDEFDGSHLDTNKWDDKYPEGRTHGPELQYYAPGAYEVGQGHLRLKGEKREMEGHAYTAGMISSYGHFSQKYGYFEIRARFPKGKGYWPAFWLLPDNRTWPPEIDVLEILGHEMNKVYLTNHWSDAEGKHQSHGSAWVGPDFGDDYHLFGVEWKQGEIIWYIDDVERFRSDQGVPDVPMYIIANLAIGGDWPGSPDAKTVFPGYMDIDYIRAYQRK